MNRRTLVVGLGLSVGTSALIGTKQSSAAPAPFDPTNPEHVLLAVRKLAFSGDDKLTFMWLRATRFGLVNGALTPFWEMHVGQFFTVKDWQGSGFEVTNMSAIFYTDPATGKFIETFKNPLSGKSVAVRYGAPRVAKRHYNVNGEQRDAITRPGMRVQTTLGIGPAWAEGDLVWVRADTSMRAVPAEGGQGRLTQINDWSTYSGSLRSVSDPEIKNPPSMWVFNDINTWAEWLEMGDQPGNYVSRGIGHKAYSFDEMPSTWKMLMKERHPQIASDPAGALNG